MTALEQYIRLEAEALWCEGLEAELRPVIVSFGNASLVISDFSDTALAHWTLAATRIVGHEGETVVYSPDDSKSETLRVSDAPFIEAIQAVSASSARKTKPKRWKLKTAVAVLVATVAVGLFFVPEMVRNWTIALVSQEQMVLITDEILDRAEIKMCTETRANQALAELWSLINEPKDPNVFIANTHAQGIIRLPDGRAILDVSVLKKAGSADAFAGWLALAVNMPDNQDGLDKLIRNADTGWSLRFAFSGALSDEELEQMTEYSVQNATLPNPDAVAAALGRLRAVGIDATSFRKSINLPLDQEYGPFRPALGDQDWLALQTICGL